MGLIYFFGGRQSNFSDNGESLEKPARRKFPHEAIGRAGR